MSKIAITNKKTRNRRRRSGQKAISNPPAPSNMFMLPLLVWCFLHIIPVTAASVVGLQHHFDDVSYAGGMAYDTSHDVVYVTGQVGPSQCYVGVIKHNMNDGAGQQFQFLSKSVFREQAVCQSLVVTKPGQGQQINVEEHGGGTALLLAAMEEGGLLTDTRPIGSDRSTMYGGMVQFHVDGLGQNALYDTTGSVLIHQDLVQIPKSIITGSTATSSKTSNRVFVASWMTENIDQTTDFGSYAELIPPNLTPSGTFQKFGRSYSMSISMIHLKTDFRHAQTGWTKPYGTVPAVSSPVGTDVDDTDGSPTTATLDSSAFVKQLFLHGNTLFVVGSTRGTGPAFGGTVAQSEDGQDDDGPPPGTMGGFITKLDPETGRIIDASTNTDDVVATKRINLRHINNSTNNASSSGSTLSSSSFGDTYIEAICSSTSDETTTAVEDAIYIVGSYEKSVTATGTMLSVPYVAKLYASSLETIWRSEFPATTNARALSCGVDETSGVVYIAGDVHDGGEIMGQTQTKLQDDIFVVQVSKHNGSLYWIRQLGTSGDDHLARGGSTSMVVLKDKAGVLVFGDTTGNFYSEATQAHEIFVARIDANGNTPETTEITGTRSNGGGDKLSIFQPVETTNGVAVTDGGTNSNVHDEVAFDSSVANNDQPPPSTSPGVLYKVLAAFTVLGVAALAVIGSRRRREDQKSTERALVFSYLQEFDIEDVDVRQSAAGGWHGTYVGKLSRGVNSRGVEDSASDTGSDDGSGPSTTYSPSSIVRDSLFMDHDSTPPPYDHEEDSDNDDVDNEIGGISASAYRDYVEDDDVEESLAQIAQSPWEKEIV